MIASVAKLGRRSSVDAYLGGDIIPREASNVMPRGRRGGDIRAKYDAASGSTEFSNYWANADTLSSDAANSHHVRRRLVSRSRYETENNGYTDGIVQTHANYLVSTGPKPRLDTGNKAIDAAFAYEWARWAKATHFRRKLWCLAHAKVQDGEGFAIIARNPRVRHDIKIDLKLVECDQVHTPYLPYRAVGVIDGVTFDGFGNPITYDILPEHPGGPFSVFAQEPRPVSARYVCHWFSMRRPGQHRGVPELRSTLHVGAASRRMREATVASVESAADHTAILHTTMSADDAALAEPFSEMPIQKRMMVALPEGYDLRQLDAKHPNAQYNEFSRAQIGEQGRPKNMPYNLAACDSSNHNYASGKLDREAYYVGLDVEREDGADMVLDKVGREFAVEFELLYRLRPGRVTEALLNWDWPSHPVADVESEANATDKKLRNGTTSLSRVYQEAGEDYDAEVERLATDYAMSVDEVKRALFYANLNASGQQSQMIGALAQQEAARARQSSTGATA